MNQEYIKKFWHEIVDIDYRWQLFSKLNQQNCSTRTLGNCHWFLLISLYEIIIIKLSRILVDNQIICGNECMTVERLANYIEDINLKEIFLKEFEDFRKESSDLKEKRNKIAHLDKKSFLFGKNPVLSVNKVSQYIEKLKNIFQRICKDSKHPNGYIYNNMDIDCSFNFLELTIKNGWKYSIVEDLHLCENDINLTQIIKTDKLPPDIFNGVKEKIVKAAEIIKKNSNKYDSKS